MYSKKKGIFIVLGATLLVLFTFFYWQIGIPRDCDIAVQQVREQVQTFTNIDAEPGQIIGGRCDGLCIKGSLAGCAISDDAHAWFVNNHGVIHQVE